MNIFSSTELSRPYKRYFRDVRLLKVYAQRRIGNPIEKDDIRVAFAELDGLIALLSRKPNLCLLGEFDSGKSTLANTLMGTELLPAEMAPHTAIPTVIRHVDDKAEWMHEGVYFLDTLLLPTSWDDQELIKKHLVAKGPIGWLHEATHEKRNEGLANACMAIVYADSPILHVCNLIDFPGYGHDEHDEENAQKFEEMADVVIYLSPFNGFLDAQDIIRIGQILLKLDDLEIMGCSGFPLLGNLFIVATHVDPRRFDSGKILKVFSKASGRIVRQLEFSIEEKSVRVATRIREEHFAERLSTFWKGEEDAHLSFDRQLLRLLTVQLPEIWEQRSNAEIEKFKKNKITMICSLIETYEKRREDLREMEKVYIKYKDEEPSRKHAMQQKVAGIVAQIRQFSEQSRSEFSYDFSTLTAPSALERLIRDKFQNKKEAEGYALGYVYEQLNKELKRILAPKTQRISDATEVFIREYRDQQILEGSRIGVGLTVDDMGAFLKGATATGTLGGLASLGLVYGGSWLAAHATGLIAAIGVGAANIGAAVATGIGAALSALTGPIGLAIVASIALFAFFRGPWQERLAKEIAKKLLEGDVLNRFLVAIEKFWKDTEKSFLGGVAELDGRWEKSLDELRIQISHPEEGEKKISDILRELTLARGFFLELPWSPWSNEVDSTG